MVWAERTWKLASRTTELQGCLLLSTIGAGRTGAPSVLANAASRDSVSEFERSLAF